MTTNKNVALVILKTALRFLWDYGKELTILVFAVTTYQACNTADSWKRQKMEAENKASRFESSVRAEQQKVQVEKRYWFENNKKLEKVIDSLQIQARKVTYVHSIKYRDTGSVKIRTLRDTIIKDSVHYPVVKGEYHRKCHNAKFVYYPDNDSIDYNYSYITDLNIIGHWRRSKELRFFGIRLFDYGAKNHFVTVRNNCEGADLLKNELVEFTKRR